MAREACTAQVVVASTSQSDREGVDDDISLLDHTDSFSDQEQQAVPTLSTLDRATTDFEVEETTGPPLSEAMALRVRHMLKTWLLPEKLKFRMDRELCPSNALSISAKKVNPSLFNKRGSIATIRGCDLQLQSVQKIMTKAMLPLVQLADSFFLAESEPAELPDPAEALSECLNSFSLLASANLQMDQLRREGFKAALPSQYKDLTNVPDPPMEMLFGDLVKRMKDLDEKAKPESNLQPAPLPKSAVTTHPCGGKAYTPWSTATRPNYRFPSSMASKNLRRFPTMDNLSTTSGKQSRGRESHTKR